MCEEDDSCLCFGDGRITPSFIFNLDRERLSEGCLGALEKVSSEIWRNGAHMPPKEAEGRARARAV